MFCWGDHSKGQLGSPTTDGDWISTPTPVNLNEAIVQVSCGEQHTLFLTVTGQILSCGRNNKGQLGRSKSRDSKTAVKIEGLGGVAAVACGQEHCLALCDSGRVFSWGAGGEGQLGISSPVAKCGKPVPVQIPSPLPISVVQVACGNFHSLALTKGGEVYSWGRNNYGQLGLGKSVELKPHPVLVQALIGVPVIQISAGGLHTLALALPSRVFCCGANGAGQLGVNRIDEKGRFTICAVPALRNMGITSISCGAAHTAVVTKSGEVYTFGEGAHGQLGHNSSRNELLPRKVEGIDGLVKQVTCGSHHTMVLMQSSFVFVFGRGVRAQEHGGVENRLQPIRLGGDWNGFVAGKQTEMKISSGWNSNFIFCSPAKTSILGNPVGKLSRTKVQRWVGLETDRNIEEAKREISLTFSTSSNLVACFMNESGTVSKNNQIIKELDLTAACQTFDELLRIPWIKSTVEMSFSLVLDILFMSSPVMKCPEIFLLLPTISILHEEKNFEMVLVLAVAITKIHNDGLKILKEYWSSMDAKMKIKHIYMWKKVLAFLLKSGLTLNFNPGVKATLEVLKYLYKANRIAKEKIPFHEFYIEEIGTVSQLLQQDVTLWYQIKSGLVKEEDGTAAVFCHYPFLLDLISKISIFNFVAAVTQMAHNVIHNNVVASGVSQAPAPIFQLKLRRTALLEDTFRQLDNADHENFQKTLLVKFVDDSIVTEVNKKDFYLHAFNDLVAPDSEMFMYNDTQTMIWFPPKPSLETKRYFLLGILCGMALYNRIVMHLPFPLAMFKKLINVKPTLEDLIEFKPEIGRSLRCILNGYPDVVDNLNINFCVHWDGEDVELVPHGSQQPVTSTNKKEYVDVYVDYVLNKSVVGVFEEFKRGFYKVCDRNVVEFFQPEELRGVMVGTEQYDWDTFKQNTAYNGQYHESHPTIIAFWEVFNELTDEQKKAFLLFLTGCERVPILGMGQIRMTIHSLPHFTQSHFPESHTCHSNLLLPPYESRQQLQDKLIEALNHNRGFWRE